MLENNYSWLRQPARDFDDKTILDSLKSLICSIQLVKGINKFSPAESLACKFERWNFVVAQSLELEMCRLQTLTREMLLINWKEIVIWNASNFWRRSAHNKIQFHRQNFIVFIDTEMKSKTVLCSLKSNGN